MWLLYPRRNRNRAPGPTVPEEHGARLAPEQKGAQGIRSPRASDPSAQKEDTRSLSMVQES